MLNNIVTIIILGNLFAVMFFMYRIGAIRFDLFRLKEMRDDKRSFADHIAKTGGNSLLMLPFPDIDEVYSEEQAVMKRQLNRTIAYFWIAVLSFAAMLIFTAHYFPELFNQNQNL